MKLATAQEIRAIDGLAISRFGLHGLQLMENAGSGIASVIKRELDPKGKKRVSIFAGKGNNGGDGFVAARHLKNSGYEPVVFLSGEIENLAGDAGANARIWVKMGGAVVSVRSIDDIKARRTDIIHSGIIVDALFGTGLSSKVSGLHAEVIDYINDLDIKKLSVDIPSGIDATTGKVLGRAVKAHITATMAMPKVGLYNYPGRAYAGNIEVIDIGVPAVLLNEDKKHCLITGELLRGFLKARNSDTHKGKFGHLLVIAGSPGKTGAAYMAAMGAMRAGAGLATIGLPESLQTVMAAKATEVMTIGLPETSEHTLADEPFEKLNEELIGKTAVVIGPGMGVTEESFRLIKKVLDRTQIPAVIDADGLTVLGKRINTLKGRGRIVLTPHPGEMARLLEISTEEVQADRIGAAKTLSQSTDGVVVLKGAGTVVATPEGWVFLNDTGNPGLSTAGTGDVLAGILGGLLVQGYPVNESACAAVYLLGLAGDEIKKQRGAAGMMATDLLEVLPILLNSFIPQPA